MTRYRLVSEKRPGGPWGKAWYGTESDVADAFNRATSLGCLAIIFRVDDPVGGHADDWHVLDSNVASLQEHIATSTRS